MKRRTLVQALISLGAVALFVLLLHRIGWAALGHAFVRIGWRGAALVFALGLLESLGDGAALVVAIGRAGALSLVGFNSVGAVINQVLPFDLGEVAKATLLSRRMPGAEAIAGTVVWNYVFKLARPLVTLAAVGIAVVGVPTLPPGLPAWMIAAAVVAFLPYVVIRFAVSRGALAALGRLSQKSTFIRTRAPRLVEVAREVDSTVRWFSRDRRLAYALTLLFLSVARVASWVSLYAAARLVGAPLSFGQGAALYAVLNGAELVFSFVPARLGVAEGSAFGLFALVGLDPSLGVIVYVVLRAKALLANGVIAPLAAWRPRAGNPPAQGAGGGASAGPRLSAPNETSGS